MSNEITTSFKKEFGSSVILLAQQKMSKLRGTVRNEMIAAEEAFFDQVGKQNVSTILNRHQDTQYTNTPHRRRRVAAVPRAAADLIDKADQVRTLNDVENAYTRSFGAALGREIDQVILDAIEADALTGKDGTTTVAFDSNMEVGLDVGGVGSMLNTDKLRRASRLLNANDVEEEDRYIVMHPLQLEAMLGETETTSADFNTVKALVNGQINSFLGFTFIHTSLCPQDKVYFYHRDGMLLAIAQEPTIRIDELPGKNYSTQVYASLDIGATRMEEARVGRILVATS